MATAYSKQGHVYSVATQASGIATAASTLYDFRPEEEPTFPTDEFLSEAQPNLGHADGRDHSDNPILYEGVRENALTVPIAIRRDAEMTGATNTPIIIQALESGGGHVEFMTEKENIAATSTSAAVVFDTAAGRTSGSARTSLGGSSDSGGWAIAVPTTVGGSLYYEPALVAHYDAAGGTIASYQANLAMAVSGDPTDGTDAEPMWTVTNMLSAMHYSYPKFLTFLKRTRGVGKTATDLAWLASGCAAGEWPEFEITQTGKIMLSPTFHVADLNSNIDSAAAPYLLASEAFVDDNHSLRANNNMRFLFADANRDGTYGLAYTSPEGLLSAKIKLGLKCSPIPGVGTALGTNGIEGYMVTSGPTQITITQVHDVNREGEWRYSPGGSADNGAQQTPKFIGFTWRCLAADINYSAGPAAFWFPCCYQIGAPTVEDTGDDSFIKVTTTYQASSANYGKKYLTSGGDVGTTEPNSTPANSDWFFALYK